MMWGTSGKVVNQGIRIGWTCWKNTLQLSRCLEFCWCSLGDCLWLGGGNSNSFLECSPRFFWGNDPIWFKHNFSDGFGKQPLPTSLWCLSWSKSTLFKTPAFFTPRGVDTPNFSHQQKALKETTRTTWRAVVSHCWHLQLLPQVLYHMTLGSYRWLLRWQRGVTHPVSFVGFGKS